jgi:hypothetical protein
LRYVACAYAPDMNPAVAAAAIGVGGTVIVGVAGFSAAVWNTRRTLADAHESRFWQKQTVAYEEALAELANRRVRRERVMRQLTSAAGSVKVLEEYFAARETPASLSAEGQLLAYSSGKVLDALDKARSADLAASEKLDEWREAWRSRRAARKPQEVWRTVLPLLAGRPSAKRPRRQVLLRQAAVAYAEQASDLAEQVADALQKTLSCDKELVGRIRAELQSARGEVTAPDRVGPWLQRRAKRSPPG